MITSLYQSLCNMETNIATDYKDAATTAALIEEQQAFTEGLSTGFWYE